MFSFLEHKNRFVSLFSSIIDQTVNDEAIRVAVKIAATNEDDKYYAKESYYPIAHRLREPIIEQSK